MLSHIKMNAHENKIKAEEVILEKPEDEDEQSNTKQKNTDESQRGKLRSTTQIENIIFSTLEERKKWDNENIDKAKIQDLREKKIKVLLKEEKLKTKRISGPIINSLTEKAKQIKEGKVLTILKSNEGKDLPTNMKSKDEDTKKTIKEDTDDATWAEVTKKNKIIANKNSNNISESSKNSSEAQNYNKYKFAWDELSNLNLQDLKNTIIFEDFSHLNFFQRIFAKCTRKYIFNPNIINERDQIFLLTKVPLKMSEKLHNEILSSTLLLITGNKSTSNWTIIGYQNSNPESDTRSVGIFGPLQMLFLSELHTPLAKSLYKLSISEDQFFPLACSLFGFSSIVLEALREGRITSKCNKEKKVLEIVNLLYVGIVKEFTYKWKDGNCTINDHGKICNDLRKYTKKHCEELINSVKLSGYNKKLIS